MGKLKLHSAGGILLAASFIFLSTASASPITGTLQVGGLVVAVNGDPSTGCVDFYNSSPGCGANANFLALAGSDGVFSGAFGSSNNIIKDMQQTFPIVKFISVPNVNVFFDLPGLSVNPFTVGDCTFTATAINETCSPAGSPFTLTNSNTINPSTGQANNVGIKLDLNLLGYQTDSASGVTPYHGQFNTSISKALPNGDDANIGNILKALNAGTILSGNSVSGNVSPSPVVPEPSSLIMLLTGSGMLGIGFMAKRRRALKK